MVKIIIQQIGIKQSSTDFSICKWPRAHFTDTEGLLLCMSTVNAHHPEGKTKNLKHKKTLLLVINEEKVNTDRPEWSEIVCQDFFLPVTAESGNILPQRIPRHPLHVTLVVIQDAQFQSLTHKELKLTE